MKRPLLLFLALLLLCAGAGRARAQAVRADEILGREAQITLNDAIRLALEHNLDIEIARTGPLSADETVTQARAAYDPSLTARWRVDRRREPTVSPFEIQSAGGPVVLPLNSTDVRNQDYESGLTGLLPYGMSYRSSLLVLRRKGNTFFDNLRPEYRSTWDSEVTLPLLRNFIDSPADIVVKRSRVAQNKSMDDFYGELRAQVQTIEESYWALSAAIDAQRVAEKSVETAQKLKEQTEIQYEVGVVSRVAVTQAVSGLAQREFDLIGAKNRADTTQDSLLSVILAPTAAGYPGTAVIPESPTQVDYQVNTDVVVAKALETSPELSSARRGFEDALLQLTLAENQRKPQLDLRLGYVQRGLSGKVASGATTLNGDPIIGFEGGRNYSDSLRDPINGDGERSWSIGAEFEIPLTNAEARSEVVQRKIELRRAKANVRRTEQQVILFARDAVRNLESALDGIEAAERGREAAAEALRAEEERLRLGDSTPFFVLEFEEDLFERENSLILALQVYRNSITELERAQGTLLESRGIKLLDEVDREPLY